MILKSNFDPNHAEKAHLNTILAAPVMPEGLVSPFDHAWGYLDKPGEMEYHKHHKEEVYFFFKGNGFVRIDGEEIPVTVGDVVRIPPDAMQSFVIRVYSGKVPAGIYQGEITVVSDNGTLNIPISVKIRNFVLPERATLRNAFCFFDKHYMDWYGLTEIPRERRLKIYDFLLSYRVNPCNIYEAKYDTPRVEDLDAVGSRINFMVFQNVSM